MLTSISYRQDGLPLTTRGRRGAQEKGSFGKSTRRSRSKTGTPARGIRDDNPTTAAADKIWGEWKTTQLATAPAASNSNTNPAPSTQRLAGMRVASQPLTSREDPLSATSASSTKSRIVNVPTEVILRGYRNNKQQYAAISHYENIAGRICEDYPREPPAEMRRYKSDLRDPALTRSQNMTPEERAKVNRADGGEHWVKVTFESAHAAEKAQYASPQRILGHMVFAEPYRNVPPARDEPIPEIRDDENEWGVPLGLHRMAGSRAPVAFAAQNIRMNNGIPDWGSVTVDTATVGTNDSEIAGPIGSGTFPTGGDSTSIEISGMQKKDGEFTRRIPTARRVQLLPAEQALMPQQSYVQRMLNNIPFIKWFTGNMIGNEVPRTDTGDFDWNRASLYWKFIWWLDAAFGIFGGDIINADKDD